MTEGTLIFFVSGRLKVVIDDGKEEEEFSSEDTTIILPTDDAW